MTKRVRDPKLRDFIEEAVENCIELLETGECMNAQNI
jgi:hypothetical protein